jgi:hypothetical protein
VNFENDDYYSATAKSVVEAQKLVETGFEYACTFNDVKLFRKRKQQDSRMGPLVFVVGSLGSAPDPKWRSLPRNPSFFYSLKKPGRSLLQIASAISVASINAGRMGIDGNSGIIVTGCSVNVRMLSAVSISPVG